MDRDEFMELVYETFADEPDNVLANGIIEAADAYVEHEKAQLSHEGTTKDAISRQQAIDALDCINGVEEVLRSLPTIQPELTDEQVIDYCRKKGYKIVADDLFDLLSKSEPQWIPVSERLPETEEFVLVSLTVKYHNITFEHACEIADYADGEWCVYAYPHMSAEKCEELIEAWMPLPEAYKPNKK